MEKKKSGDSKQEKEESNPIISCSPAYIKLPLLPSRAQKLRPSLFSSLLFSSLPAPFYLQCNKNERGLAGDQDGPKKLVDHTKADVIRTRL